MPSAESNSSNRQGTASQKDIATALGLSRTTVSLALSGHPRISNRTRKLVEKTARKMGYQRDPMLGALAAYRRTRHPKEFQGVLAWIMSSASGLDWRYVLEFQEYFRGASARALQLGYKLEVLDLQHYGNSAQQLSRVLKNRGIRGCMVGPMPGPYAELDIPFETFPTVLFGYSVQSPETHRIASYHYRCIIRAVDEIRRLGYQRIGYVIDSRFTSRVSKAYLAGYLVKQREMAPKNRLAPLESTDATDVLKWKDRYRPDAVITGRHYLNGWPESLFRGPDNDIGLAVVSVDPSSQELAGINECSFDIGQLGSQVLAFLVEHHELGLLEQPQHWLVEPKWQDGPSLPDRS